MELIELNADIRKTTGNGPARTLRREGRIPAVFYGPNSDPVLLSMNVKALERPLKESGGAGQTIFSLVINGAVPSTKTVMLKELQTHPVSQDLIHADFYEIDMDRKINVNIPVIVTGKSVGVEKGGLLQIVRRELEIFCFPGEIPEAVSVDITNLDVGDSLHINEIPLVEGIEIASDANFTVLTIVAPKIEVEEEAEEMEEEVADETLEAPITDGEE